MGVGGAERGVAFRGDGGVFKFKIHDSRLTALCALRSARFNIYTQCIFFLIFTFIRLEYSPGPP
jgi:hypothetical protein